LSASDDSSPDRLESGIGGFTAKIGSERPLASPAFLLRSPV